MRYVVSIPVWEKKNSSKTEFMLPEWISPLHVCVTVNLLFEFNSFI